MSLPPLPVSLMGNPVRVHTVRRQLDELERIRAFAKTLPDHDYARWRACLEPLHEAVAHDLACHEGTGSLGSLIVAGYTLEANP